MLRTLPQVDVTPQLAPDVAALVAALAAQGGTVAVAESLTGGLVCATLVDVPGVSRVLRGGVVAYATDLKHALLGVQEDLLDREGAVHPLVAAQLATGVAARLGARWGLATTGVAGPQPQDGRPAGTVHVAVAALPPVQVTTPGSASPDVPDASQAPDASDAPDAPDVPDAPDASGAPDEPDVVVVDLHLDGDRAAVRQGAVNAVLNLFALLLQGDPARRPA